MPGISDISFVNYAGVLLLLVGVFLTLVGLSIIKLRWLDIASGRMIWTTGIILTIVGIGLSLPFFYFRPSPQPPIPISTVVSPPSVIPFTLTETALPTSSGITKTAVPTTSAPTSLGPVDTVDNFNEEQFSLFMQFYYPEIKDLTLQFLTLSSSILAFSVVFAEKVVVLKTPIGKKHIPIITSWVLLALGLILGGYGLWKLYTAGEIANGSLIYQYNIDFIALVRSIYTIKEDKAERSYIIGHCQAFEQLWGSI